MKKKFLILGSGGREHALAWHLKLHGDDVECAPGSDAIAEMVPTWSFKDFQELKTLATEKLITDIIVGPEKYLDEGIADFFEGSIIQIFGPTKKAAQLETDKAWSKDFCNRHNIPTAKALSVTSADRLKNALQEFKAPYVVKAAGLAAGKGVWIGDSREEAQKFGEETLREHSTLVVEEFLNGQEVSYFCLVDGDQSILLGSAQDHKRLLENDQGPNTGGMGSYGPLKFMDTTLEGAIHREVVLPTLQGLQTDNIPFRGFIFFGLMICDGRPYVLEYNCRMGDPETQSLLLRVKSPLSDMLRALEDGTSSSYHVQYEPGVSMNIVLAAKGYPESPEKGFSLEGIDRVPPGTVLFHAGTKIEDGSYVANGGRLVSICTRQPSLLACQNLLYPWIESLPFLDKIAYRKDIGVKAHAKRTTP